MTDSKEATRDWMAAQYALNRFPIQNIETGKDPTQDINFLRRITVAESYQVGFDAGYQVAMDEANEILEDKLAKVHCDLEDAEKRIQKLRDALEFYANAKNWEYDAVLQESNLKKEMEHTFVRGELSALKWVYTAKSLSEKDKEIICYRMKALESFISGKIKADKDGTIARWVPDFYKGE